MPVYGTKYGGWFLPDDLKLNEKSIVVSAGVGEDISWDLLIQNKFNCKVFLVDPTERAIKHFEEVKDFFETGKSFTGNIQPDYLEQLEDITPAFSCFTYLPVGLWSEKTTLKFYKQTNPEYVSQSLVKDMYGIEYTKVPVDRLKNLMKENNIKKIDVLKLDIEGAEIEVLETLIQDGIFPKVLCVEFDLALKGKDKYNETQKIVNRLLYAGYKVISNQNLNVVFERQLA